MQIEIWSDIACPWCYIGKRRFEAALAGFEHRDEVEVTWRSFELDPGAPAEREGDLAEHLAAKYGASVEQMRASQAQIDRPAAAEGIDFRSATCAPATRSTPTGSSTSAPHTAPGRGQGAAMRPTRARAT